MERSRGSTNWSCLVVLYPVLSYSFFFILRLFFFFSGKEEDTRPAPDSVLEEGAKAQRSQTINWVQESLFESNLSRNRARFELFNFFLFLMVRCTKGSRCLARSDKSTWRWQGDCIVPVHSSCWSHHRIQDYCWTDDLHGGSAFSQLTTAENMRSRRRSHQSNNATFAISRTHQRSVPVHEEND